MALALQKHKQCIPVFSCARPPLQLPLSPPPPPAVCCRDSYRRTRCLEYLTISRWHPGCFLIHTHTHKHPVLPGAQGCSGIMSRSCHPPGSDMRPWLRPLVPSSSGSPVDHLWSVPGRRAPRPALTRFDSVAASEPRARRQVTPAQQLSISDWWVGGDPEPAQVRGGWGLDLRP